MLPTHRPPTHPGEMLREDFMTDYGLTVVGLAEAAGVSRQSVNELLRGRLHSARRWPCACRAFLGIRRSSD